MLLLIECQVPRYVCYRAPVPVGPRVTAFANGGSDRGGTGRKHAPEDLRARYRVEPQFAYPKLGGVALQLEQAVGVAFARREAGVLRARAAVSYYMNWPAPGIAVER